jgi:hypothetical protein
LGAINFVVSYLASLFFFGAFPSFRINSLPLVFSAPARNFFFVLAPLFLFNPQRLFGRQTLGFNLSASCCFLCLHAHEFSLQLGDFIGHTCGDRRVFDRGEGRFQNRCGRHRCRSPCFGRQDWRGWRFDGPLLLKDLQQLGLVRGQRGAQFFGDRAFRRVDNQSIIAGRTYFHTFGAQLSEQFVSRHISITSRSVSNDWGAG